MELLTRPGDQWAARQAAHGVQPSGDRRFLDQTKDGFACVVRSCELQASSIGLPLSGTSQTDDSGGVAGTHLWPVRHPASGISMLAG